MKCMKYWDKSKNHGVKFVQFPHWCFGVAMLVTMIWNGIEHEEVIYAFIVVPYKQKHLWDQIDYLF